MLLGGAGLPGVGPGDPRIRVDVNQVPWRAVGRLQTELGGRCTGFLVAPRTVLTAAHCLFLQRVGHYVQPGSVHFVVGYAMGAFAGHARVVSYAVAPAYDPTREAQTVGADWAALLLDTPLGAGGRVLPLLRESVAVGAAVVLGGYDRDREEVMEADLACRVTALMPSLVRHDCAGTGGTSGAPLLVRGADGTWSVAGLQVAATLGHAGGVAVDSSVIILK